MAKKESSSKKGSAKSSSSRGTPGNHAKDKPPVRKKPVAKVAAKGRDSGRFKSEGAEGKERVARAPGRPAREGFGAERDSRSRGADTRGRSKASSGESWSSGRAPREDRGDSRPERSSSARPFARGAKSSEGTSSYRGAKSSEGPSSFRGRKPSSDGPSSFRGVKSSEGPSSYRGRKPSAEGSTSYRGAKSSEGPSSYRGAKSSEAPSAYRGRKPASDGPSSFRGAKSSDAPSFRKGIPASTSRRSQAQDEAFEPKARKSRDRIFGDRGDEAPRFDRKAGGSKALGKDRYVEKTFEDPKFRSFLIWGKHPVEGAIAELHERETPDVSAHELHVIGDKAGKVPPQLKDMVDSAKTLGIKIHVHSGLTEDWPLGEDSVNHQRLCLKTPFFKTHELEEALEIVRGLAAEEFVGCAGAVLDQIQDPRNFGAVLRSASFFGLKFVVYAKDRQSELSPLIVRTSAGGAFNVMLVPVTNISRALADIKKAGAWIVGAGVNKTETIHSVPVDRPLVAVLGNEGKGLRPEVAKNCDYLVSIPGGSVMVDSLNVSVAAGIFFSKLNQSAAAPTEDESEYETDEDEIDEDDSESDDE
jgi:23S rRNA (guanosine2251-2'-O)-methyltransferase